MAIICPTVTAGNPHAYRTQMERISPLTHRLHIDLMDKNFTPHQSVGVDEVWWPIAVQADIHVMFKNPNDFLIHFIRHNPALVIVHAEADGDFHKLNETLKYNNIKVGVALLKDTPVSHIESVLNDIDHVLIFSGDLGQFGGHADLSLLEKVQAIKAINPNIEIGWDGGINEHNIKQLADGGVDVLNVGGFIQRAENPGRAYARLKALLEEPANAPKTDN